MTIVSRLLLVLAACLAAAPPVSAGDASRWQQGLHSRARLVSGGADLAGVEIVLDPGYKTYWRQPGEAGLPPRFDWTGSGNLAGAEVLWPAPSRTVDAGGVAYSYADRVLFPVRVQATRPGKTVQLRLAVEYGVCKEICIPAHAELTLAIGGSGHRGLIEEAIARVPVRRPLGAEGPLAVLGLEPVAGEKPSYRVRVRAPADAALFAEGPENWFVSTSELNGDAFTVTVEEKPKESGAAPLLLTLTGGGAAVETEVPLDGALRPR